MTIPRAGLVALALHPLLAGCLGGAGLRRFDPPSGADAFGVTFGTARAAVEKKLTAAGARPRPEPAEADALVVDSCPGAPVEARCVFHFSPGGLYAAEQQVPLADTAALVRAVKKGLGEPVAATAGSDVVASWEPAGWSVAVARHPEWKPPVATFRAEFDAAAPPVVAGVPLGRLRADVEALLATQGATLIQRDAEATSYLGCPLGEADGHLLHRHLPPGAGGRRHRGAAHLRRRRRRPGGLAGAGRRRDARYRPAPGRFLPVNRS